MEKADNGNIRNRRLVVRNDMIVFWPQHDIKQLWLPEQMKVVLYFRVDIPAGGGDTIGS